MGADAGPEQQLLRETKPAASTHHDRVALRTVPRPLLRHSPVANPDDAVGDAGRLRVVTDDHRGAAVLAHQLGERRIHLVGRRRVELAGRLVREKHARTVCKRGTERDALLLASGELRGQAVPLRGEPDTLEQLVCPPHALGGVRAAKPELQ